jgi:FAD/FMN-containing dehydrogenase
MIDLSLMNTVAADADARRAFARGGALLNALDSAALEVGLITTAGVVSHTGVGGFTLGGGMGRLNRKYGLAVDNLRSAEIVTADGVVRRVSEDQDADLFWAIRGGGGNFGVVTEFELELYPFERRLFSGNIIWPVAQARDVLEFYGEWYQGLSDEMYVGPAMATGADGEGVILMEVVFNGDPAAGEKELEPLRKIGKPVDDAVGMQDYMVMQTQEDAAFGHGVRSYIKNGMVSEITQGLVDMMIESFTNDSRLAMFTHTLGGAAKRVGESDTAFPHRNAETMVGVGGGWMDPADDESGIALSREWYYKLEPFMGGYYDNIDFDGAEAAGNYGPAYERLRKIKGQHDPGNLFRHWFVLVFSGGGTNLRTTAVSELPPRLIDDDGRSVGEIQAAAARTHRQPEPLLRRQRIKNLLRQATRFRAEQERVSLAVGRLVVRCRSARAEREHAGLAELL